MPDAITAEVSPDLVEEITDISVDAALIRQARSVIELYLSVPLDNLRTLQARNRFWVSRAIAYQAVFMLSQPDFMGRADLQSVSQDGQSIATRGSDTWTLAPLAKVAISRCSWARTRTVRVRRNMRDQHTQFGTEQLAQWGPLQARQRIYDYDDGL